MQRLKLFVALMGLTVTLGLTHPVSAHAIIVDSAPALNATVIGKDIDIKLHYNSRIDHGRSKLILFGPDNVSHNVASQKNAAPDILAGSCHELTPGAWRLRWQVLSVDGHITRGDIAFTVQ